MPPVRPAIQRLLPFLIDLRRALHQCPEIMYKEYETSALARRTLEEAGLTVLDGLGETGLAAVWDSGQPGPTVAIRADMDGLNVTEPEGSPFRSKNPGMMHACGHDFHLALLLGLARLIHAGGLAPLRGRVMFICQPAEEHGAGAAAMLRDGLYEKTARPDMIFAAHAEPMRLPGRLIINPGPIMAGVVDIHIQIHGRGGHAGTPDSAINPLPAMARLISGISSYKPPAGALITLATAHCGERTNVIAPDGAISGTLRYYSRESRQTIQDYVARRCREVAEESKTRIEWQWVDGYPPTINNPEAAALAQEVADSLLAPGAAGPETPSYGGEDFSFFLEKTPGAFLFLGTGGAPGGNYPLHSPNFSINEEAIPIGLEFWARLLEKILH
jgi:amidohydrolase